MAAGLACTRVHNRIALQKPPTDREITWKFHHLSPGTKENTVKIAIIIWHFGRRRCTSEPFAVADINVLIERGEAPVAPVRGQQR